MKTLGGYQPNPLLFQARRLKRKVKKDTQKLREMLLEELESMLKIAKQYVEEGRQDPKKAKQVQHWIRVIGYIGQVMNGVSDSFDEARALDYLKNLVRMIREAKEHNQGSREA